jgi:23S rRNA (adenine-N6)-dimethyltransferase
LFAFVGGSPRDERRRTFSQNFLEDRELAEELAFSITESDLVLEIGAGSGALTIPLASRGARVLALERDPVWARRLQHRLRSLGLSDRVRILVADFRVVELPSEPFRVVANPPFSLTTSILRKLLDNPGRGPQRADLLLQWEVAQKRAHHPPRNMLSTMWAPWWSFELVRRVPRHAFRPVPATDVGWLAVTKRAHPILPEAMAQRFSGFVESNWDAIVREQKRSRQQGSTRCEPNQPS